jgi:hypothetical protein
VFAVLYAAVPDSVGLDGGTIIHLIGNFSLEKIPNSALQCNFQTSDGFVPVSITGTPNNTVIDCPAAA